MKITRITNDDVRLRLREAYNPPTLGSKGDEEAFRREMAKVRAAIGKVISKFGREDFRGDGDYCLSSDWTFSRGIGVTVTKDGFLTAGVLEEIQKSLLGMGLEYEIYLSHFMRGVSKWDVFVNCRECLVFGEISLMEHESLSES